MSVKAKVEAIIYATEEPVTISQLASLLHGQVLAELRAEENARLVRNETLSDGKPSPSEDEADEHAASETDAAEGATEPDSTPQHPTSAANCCLLEI